MKKRFLAILCALSLLLGVFLPAHAAQSGGTVYLLALNEKICDLPGGLLPISSGGTVYVPYTAFDKSITGVNMGVYYGLDQSQGTVLTLYALPGSLSFYVRDGVCLDGNGNEMDFHAISRGGSIYVPAAAVCRQFGLNYSALPTTDRGTLIRISNADATLSDSILLNIMALSMSSRYNDIMGKNPSAQPSATPRPTPSQAPEQSHEEDLLYLALDASQAEASLLNALSASQAGALLFFTPDSLTSQASLVRKAICAGHSIGLRISADSSQEALEQLARGNDLLCHIARVRTHIVLADAALLPSLTEQGWRCWRPNVSGTTATAILRSMDGLRGETRVTLPADAAAISRILSQAHRDRYELRTPVETSL